ncbi:MAG: hypothetical protein RLZZ200_1362, partial [Pseudomonadota bacterium]
MPDLHVDRESLDGTDTATLPRLPAFEAFLRFGTRLPQMTKWQSAVANWAGRPELGDRTPASVVAAAASLPEPGAAWLATPVHLVAGLDHVRLHPAGLLRLEPDVAERLAIDFARTFGEDGLALHPVGGGFLLSGLPPLDARTEVPARLLGSNLRQAPPTGPDAHRLRRLATEIEMWLHGLAESGSAMPGRAPNALWLWGGGRSQGSAIESVPGQSCYGALFADDAVAAALWQLG